MADPRIQPGAVFTNGKRTREVVQIVADKWIILRTIGGQSWRMNLKSFERWAKGAEVKRAE